MSKTFQEHRRVIKIARKASRTRGWQMRSHHDQGPSHRDKSGKLPTVKFAYSLDRRKT